MIDGHWIAVKDGDERAFALYQRHYTALPYRDGRRRRDKRFCGPGEKLVLLTQNCDALFVWRKFMKPDLAGQEGVNCSVFRNEGDYLSSELILEAEQLAWQIWPGERLYTYVNPRRIRSTNPGYCYKIAGWQVLEKRTTKGLLILEKLPEAQ